jgi:hypothetical protein
VESITLKSAPRAHSSGSLHILLCSTFGKKCRARHFSPYQSAPSNSEIATPDYIYAADPSGETHRPCETVTPLAAWLNYAQGSAQFNVSYSVGGGEPDLVKSVLARSGVVLICWEHDNIMPNIVGRINDSKYPIANYSAIPNAWYMQSLRSVTQNRCLTESRPEFALSEGRRGLEMLSR